MVRKDLELELLTVKFDSYTEKVRNEITRVVKKHKCDDISDTVIDGLWISCREDLLPIIKHPEINTDHDVKSDTDDLSLAAREKIRDYIDKALEYEGELGDYDDVSFAKIYRDHFEPIIREKREYRALKAQRNDNWAFFNLPGADADFSQWKSRFLQPAQAVALSFGKDPDAVNPASLEPYRRPGGSPFRVTFKERLDLVVADVEAGQLSVPMSISEFEQWAVSRGIYLPLALSGRATLETEGDAAFWKSKFETVQAELDNLKRKKSDLDTKTRRSLYRLILGMAIARFEYRTDQRSKATSIIRDELADIGLHIKDDAIREHIGNAVTDLDFEWLTPRKWQGVRTR